MKKILFSAMIVLSLIFLQSYFMFGYNPENWTKKLGQTKSRRVVQRQTTVAAIRGVEEPKDVDPKLRDFQGVEKMEKETLASENVAQFVKNGQLKEVEAKKEDGGSAASQLLAGSIMQTPVSGRMKEAVRPITTEEEVALGRDVAANVIAQFGLYSNEPLTRYVNLVGLTVARSSPRQDVTYRFAILDSNIINAFAAPGGYIFISKGLLFLLKNEAELAGVLGHEIAHVTQRHVVKEIQKSNVVQAAIPSYIKESAKQAVWMQQVTGLAIQMLWKGLSREDELESDRLGLEFSSACGYHPRSFKEVLEMLKSKSSSGAGNKELKFLLSTHPKPEDRIRDMDEKLKLLPQDGQTLPERFSSKFKL